MRALLVLVAFAACAPAPPPRADLALGGARVGQLAYICTAENHEVAQFVSSNGEVLDMRATGRACDYAHWCAQAEARGPVYARGEIMTHREWLRRMRPDA